MKHTHRHSDLDQLVATIPPELQPELASFLDEHADKPSIKLLNEGAIRVREIEAKHARNEALEEYRKAFDEKMTTHEMRIMEHLKEAKFDDLSNLSSMREQLLNRIELLLIDNDIRSRRRQRYGMITLGVMLFGGVSTVIIIAIKSIA